jgi:hypothetical protein
MVLHLVRWNFTGGVAAGCKGTASEGSPMRDGAAPQKPRCVASPPTQNGYMYEGRRQRHLYLA